jgi:hypothetical protein
MSSAVWSSSTYEVDSCVLQARCCIICSATAAMQCQAVPHYACVLVCSLCVCHITLITTSSSSDDDSDTEAPAAKKAKTSSPVRDDEMAD